MLLVCFLQFVIDGMLGKLTRWLRMLGHDVTYYQGVDDKELILLAKSEKRVLLTRDRDLYQQAIRRGLDSFFVDLVSDACMLAVLARRFGFSLVFDFTVSRCPKCNGELESVSKAAVLDKLHEGTVSCYDDFWLCVVCGQVYWHGAHWKRIMLVLDEANRLLGLL